MTRRDARRGSAPSTPARRPDLRGKGASGPDPHGHRRSAPGHEALASGSVQPTTQQPRQQLLRELPEPRLRMRVAPYTGPYSQGYMGPDRPFPEPRRRAPGSRGRLRPMPIAALAAGTLGIAGTLPLALLVGAAVALGGLWGDTGVEWWLYPLLAAPLLQLWGAIELLIGRSWWLLVVTCLPGAALLAYLVVEQVVNDQGMGWYTPALGAPVLALLLAGLPAVRRWVASRRRFAAGQRTRG